MHVDRGLAGGVGRLVHVLVNQLDQRLKRPIPNVAHRRAAGVAAGIRPRLAHPCETRLTNQVALLALVPVCLGLGGAECTLQAHHALELVGVAPSTRIR